MFKRILLCGLAIASFAVPTSAGVMVFVEADGIDNFAMKFAVQGEMSKLNNEVGNAFKSQQAEIRNLKGSFIGLHEEEVVTLFGSKVEMKPKTFALPVYDNGYMTIWGRPLYDGNQLGNINPPKDFYEISDFAAAKIIYQPSNRRVRAILFYLRTDETFPKLEGWNNLKSRIAWDDSRIAMLKTWIAAHKKVGVEPPS